MDYSGGCEMDGADQNKITKKAYLEPLFQDKLARIGKYLGKPILAITLTFKYQEENTLEISDLGLSFGTKYDKDTMVILGNWMLNLTEKERIILEDFIVAREAFRVYMNQDIPEKHNYDRFTENILQLLTVLWIIEDYPKMLTSYHVSVVRQRTDAYEDEEHILKSDAWVYFMSKCVQHDIFSKAIYPVFVSQVKDAIKEEKPIADLAWLLMRWMKALLPEEFSTALPFHIKKERYYDLIKTMGERNYETSSALQISEVVGKSHNSVTVSFKQLMDDFGIFWFPNIDILKIKLYPYFMRIHTKKKTHHDSLVEKLKSIKYCRMIRENISNDEYILVGWIEGPLIVYEQLLEYLEKLKNKELVTNYFLKQIRHKKVTWSISTKELTPDEETYQQIFNTTDDESCTTITAMDDKYELASLGQGKEEFFSEEALMFIAGLMSKHLGKSSIMFRPIEIAYELCEKNGVDSEDSGKVRDFINQIEIRCRKLGIFDFILFHREFFHFKKALYFEIPLTQSKQVIIDLLEKLEKTSEMIRLALMDEVIVIFPEVKYDDIAREQIEKLLLEKNIQSKCFQLNYHSGLKVRKFMYHEAYDFDTNLWKIY